jgi:hypothetical protein
MPEAQGKAASVSVPTLFRADGTYMAWVKVPGPTPVDGRCQQISTDPYHGAVLGVWEWKKYLISIIVSQGSPVDPAARAVAHHPNTGHRRR